MTRDERKAVRAALRQQAISVQLLNDLRETRRNLFSVTSALGFNIGLSAEDGALLESVRQWIIRREEQTQHAVNNPPILEADAE